MGRRQIDNRRGSRLRRHVGSSCLIERIHVLKCMRGRSPDPAPPPLAPAPLWPTLLEPLAGPNTEEMPLECSGRRRSHDQRLHIDHPAAPPKRLAPPATTTPKNNVKADARRRPPTIARPSLYACSLCMQHAFLPFLERSSNSTGAKVC